MSKYCIGQNFVNIKGAPSVDLNIIFIPPIVDGKTQMYLCTVCSLYANGGRNLFLSLKSESDITQHFKVFEPVN